MRTRLERARAWASQQWPTLKRVSQGLLLLAVLATVGLIIYWAIWANDSPPWTGFGEYINPEGNLVRPKTLWDWLDLLIVPIFLAAAAWWLNRGEKQAEREAAEKRTQADREIALDRQHQATLEAYFDRMTDLLLEKGLGQKEGDEERGESEAIEAGALPASIARARTLAVLRTLDPARVSAVLRFLNETKVEKKTLSEIVPLAGGELSRVEWSGRDADLSKANLRDADLNEANLSGAVLIETNLRDADLNEANLSGAILRRANLQEAIMWMADLSQASLIEVNLSGADLDRANLSGVYLRWTNLREAYLGEADLSGAILRGINLSGANLSGANLSGARYTSDTTWPDGFDPVAAGAVLIDFGEYEEE